DRPRQPRPVTLSACGLQQGAVNEVPRARMRSRNLRQRTLLAQCREPVNFGLCRAAIHGCVETNLGDRKLWFMPRVWSERKWGCSCPRVGTSLRRERGQCATRLKLN